MRYPAPTGSVVEGNGGGSFYAFIYFILIPGTEKKVAGK
jgi:hypothetical protein